MVGRKKFASNVRGSIIQGRELQKTHSDILVKLRRNGRTYPQIIDEANLRAVYPDRKDATLESYLSVAYRGHDGSFGIEPFPGLLPEKEHEEWIEIHNYGNELYLQHNRLGIFGMTFNQKSEAVKKGLSNLTLEEKSKRGKATAMKRGDQIWTPVKREVLYRLSESPEYLHTDPHYRGRININKLATAFDIAFNNGKNITSNASIRNQLRLYKKQLKYEKESLEQAA